MLRYIVTLALVLSFSPVCANADYYSDSAKGFWWGDRTVPEEPKEEEKPEKKPAPAPEEKKKPFIPPALSTAKYEDVWNMHPDDFMELQEAYKKKAVQNPSEANVKDYYEMQEIARKKSLEFTNTAQYVWQKHPELTVVKEAPTSVPGNRARQGSIATEQAQLLRNNKDDYALIYFWKPNCSFCDEQKPILKWFQNETGWTVKAVNILENPALAQKIGVEMTPTLVLIKKGNTDHFPVSSGVISSNEISDKTYRAVRLLNGEITPQEYSIYEFQKGGGFDIKGRQDWVK